MTGERPPEYAAWSQMKGKCYNPNQNGFANHGAIGVTVCERWRGSFEAFLEDVGCRPSAAHVLRLYPNRDGSFEPGNCQWVISAEVGGTIYRGKWTDDERQQVILLRRKGLLYRDIAAKIGRSIASIERLVMEFKRDGVDLSLQMPADGPLAKQYPSRTRDAARDCGHTRYFDGVPCLHGHIAPKKSYSKACCECVRLRLGARYQKYKKTITRKQREARAKNPEFHRQKQREYIERNIEKVRIARKIGNNRRRERMERVEGSHTAEDLCKILKMQNGRCGYCRKRVQNGNWHADHIKPIARGGSNWPANIQVLCPSCNSRKHARDPIDFAQSIGFLI